MSRGLSRGQAADSFWRKSPGDCRIDALTAFGLFAVTAMLVCYALEKRSPWWIVGFALSCWLGSAYGFLQGAWPFGIVEAIWGGVAFRRWWAQPAVH
jgi:hypothetical protein